MLILGATGSAGQLAVQVARQLGAGQIIAAGRNQLLLNTLPRLGADAVVGLDGDPADVFPRLGRAAREVDVVIDCLWGTPTARAMTALVTDRTDRGKALSWIQIGSVAGPTADIPSAALRAANLRILAAVRGRSAPPTSSPNSRNWRARSPTARWPSTRSASRCPASKRPGMRRQRLGSGLFCAPTENAEL